MVQEDFQNHSISQILIYLACESLQIIENYYEALAYLHVVETVQRKDSHDLSIKILL